jgi:hypothetical protein
MPVVTSTVQPSKLFSWSYSRLRDFEVCARQFYEVKVLKRWPEEKSEQLVWGDRVHKALAAALSTNRPLPEEFADYQPWLDKLTQEGTGDLQIECQWAIDQNYKMVPWFSPKAWLRCIADVAKINDDVALVVDWKTGKSANVDVLQLTLTSLMTFCLYPEVLKVRSMFVWLGEDAKTVQEINRHEAPAQWAELLPRVERFRQAVADEFYPPTPNRFCRAWCAVRSCEYYGT